MLSLRNMKKFFNYRWYPFLPGAVLIHPIVVRDQQYKENYPGPSCSKLMTSLVNV